MGAAQYDIHETADRTLVVVLQSDLLDQLRTRVVAPLISRNRVERHMTSLNPLIEINGVEYILMPQLAATLTISELGRHIGSAEGSSDDITRAVDALLGGI